VASQIPNSAEREDASMNTDRSAARTSCANEATGTFIDGKANSRPPTFAG
jgi:hypothetical protein